MDGHQVINKEVPQVEGAVVKVEEEEEEEEVIGKIKEEEKVQEEEAVKVEEKKDKECVFLFDDGIVWPKEMDQLLSEKDPKNKKRLKSIVIKADTNNENRVKLALLDEEYQLNSLPDENQVVIRLAYYIDSPSTLNKRKNSIFHSYENYTNYTRYNGLCPFHMACAMGHADVVKTFLDNGEHIHVRFVSDCIEDRRNKFTPLHFAVTHQNTEVVKLLLERGADVAATDSLGITPLHLACAVSWDFKKSASRWILRQPTCWAADLEILQLLCKSAEHNYNLNLKDHHGNTPLLSIFKNDYYGPLLVKDIMTKDFHGMDTLATFLQWKQIGKFLMLIDQSVDLTAKNYDDENILHRVIEDLTSRRFAPSNKVECDVTYAAIILMLLKADVGLDVNAKNRKGETPLALAVSLMSSEIVKILLDNNADPSGLCIDSHHFFRYPEVSPTIDLISNFEKIISALLHKRGYKFTPKDNLVIMKFLAHEVDDCNCDGIVSKDEILYMVSQLIFYDSSAHMKRVILKSCKSSNVILKHGLYTIIELFVEYCKLFSYPLIMDEEVLEILDGYINTGVQCVQQSTLQEYKKDLSLMKSTKLKNGLTLYDILTKFPRITNIPMYLQYYDEDFDMEELPFNHTLTIKPVFNRLKKMRVRMYIANAASENYMNLLLPHLPDHCYKWILDYLDHQDILRLCAAALLY